jgi:hypothetical protein
MFWQDNSVATSLLDMTKARQSAKPDASSSVKATPTN